MPLSIPAGSTAGCGIGRISVVGSLAIVLAATALANAAQAEERSQERAQERTQDRAPKRPTITLPSLTAQGFEVKAALGSNLVLQKGKDVWLCYMLMTRSSCDPAE